MQGLGKLTYELPSTNTLDKMTLEYQYTRSMMENTMHIRTCVFFSSISIFYLFIFLQRYKYTYPEHKQMNPKYDINNE